MRVVLLIAGVAVVVVAAAVVPLPWSVSEPGTLVSAPAQVDIVLAPELARTAGGGEISGEYLTVRHRDRAGALQLLVAALAPAQRITRSAPDPAPGAVPPVVAATMAGLGIVPRYADVADLPVTADVAAGVDPRSLGVALHAFDVGTSQDVARGRRILGVGRLLDGGDVVCAPGAGAAARAAVEQRIDVIVVASECAAQVRDDFAAAQVQVLDADFLPSAVQALLDS